MNPSLRSIPAVLAAIDDDEAAGVDVVAGFVEPADAQAVTKAARSAAGMTGFVLIDLCVGDGRLSHATRLDARCDVAALALACRDP